MTTETTKAARAPLPLTDAHLAELERLEAVASSGPWFVWRGASGGAWLARDADGGEVIGTESTLDAGTMEMIAAARNAMPSLLAEVRASRASPTTSQCANAKEDAMSNGGGKAAPTSSLRASPEEGRGLTFSEVRAALRSPPAPSEDRGRGDSEDEITRRLKARFRDGVEAAARILAGKGIDCRSLLDIRDPDTLTEIAETLAKTQPSAPPPEDSGAREVGK